MSKNKHYKQNTPNKRTSASEPIKKNTVIDLKPQVQQPVVQTNNGMSNNPPVFTFRPIKLDPDWDAAYAPRFSPTPSSFTLPDFTDDESTWQDAPVKPAAKRMSEQETRKVMHDAKVWFGLIPADSPLEGSQKRGVNKKK